MSNTGSFSVSLSLLVVCIGANPIVAGLKVDAESVEGMNPESSSVSMFIASLFLLLPVVFIFGSVIVVVFLVMDKFASVFIVDFDKCQSEQDSMQDAIIFEFTCLDLEIHEKLYLLGVISSLSTWFSESSGGRGRLSSFRIGASDLFGRVSCFPDTRHISLVVVSRHSLDINHLVICDVLRVVSINDLLLPNISQERQSLMRQLSQCALEGDCNLVPFLSLSLLYNCPFLISSQYALFQQSNSSWFGCCVFYNGYTPSQLFN